jgi:hypothetical protein
MFVCTSVRQRFHSFYWAEWFDIFSIELQHDELYRASAFQICQPFHTALTDDPFTLIWSLLRFLYWGDIVIKCVKSIFFNIPVQVTVVCLSSIHWSLYNGLFFLAQNFWNQFFLEYSRVQSKLYQNIKIKTWGIINSLVMLLGVGWDSSTKWAIGWSIS